MPFCRRDQTGALLRTKLRAQDSHRREQTWTARALQPTGSLLLRCLAQKVPVYKAGLLDLQVGGTAAHPDFLLQQCWTNSCQGVAYA